MRMTNFIFDCDDSSYSNQNTVPHDLLPEFFSPSCLHESENTQCLSLSFLSVLCLALVILFLAVSSCSGWSGFRLVVSRSDLSRWFLTLPVSVSPPAPFVTLTPRGQQPDSRPVCQSPWEPHRHGGRGRALTPRPLRAGSDPAESTPDLSFVLDFSAALTHC